jgi:hypothetical protein
MQLSYSPLKAGLPVIGLTHNSFDNRTTLKEDIVPRAQKEKTNALQVPLPRRLSWPCVSDLQLI